MFIFIEWNSIYLNEFAAQIAPDNISKLSFVILYFMCMLTEIYVPCYFGSVALEKSNQIAIKIYESNWIEQDQRYKQAFRLFVGRTFHPVHICVNKVLLLDLHTFLKVKIETKKNCFIMMPLFLSCFCCCYFQILKTAYSLFALLKNA